VVGIIAFLVGQNPAVHLSKQIFSVTISED